MITRARLRRIPLRCVAHGELLDVANLYTCGACVRSERRDTFVAWFVPAMVLFAMGFVAYVAISGGRW